MNDRIGSIIVGSFVTKQQLWSSSYKIATTLSDPVTATNADCVSFVITRKSTTFLECCINFTVSHSRKNFRNNEWYEKTKYAAEKTVVFESN